ncbi:MAG: hypothetical protein JO148_15230 [Acidimicrobiia bacterium]|nr:hypothetical protein [Acidimicrobiia bacterium]
MRTRRIRALVLVALGVLLGAAFGFRIATARADTTLGSYSAIASAPGIEGTEDEPSAQAHPEGQGDVPYTTSLLTNGGVGYGLSSIAWPGAYGGNAGSLILVALPSQAGPVPVPDAVKGAVETVSPALQYPIRAEARAGSAPDVSYNQIPGTTLTSHADTNNVNAVADVQGAQQPGVATYGNLHSDSSSTLDGNSVKALADSTVQNINLGGVIKIQSLISTATATTDGTTSSANGGTIVKGVTVAGLSASLDQDGLHIGSSTQPLNAAASQAANQALDKAGMKVYVSQPLTEKDGGNITYQASSVVITWIPPSDPSNNVIIVTLGGARVSVAAGAGFDSGSQQPADTGGGVAPSDTGGGGDASVLGNTAASGDTGAGTIGLPASTGTNAQSTGTGGGQSLGGVDIAKTFGGIGAGWLLAGLLAAVLIGFGSSRLIADLVDKPPATCPLEVRR